MHAPRIGWKLVLGLVLGLGLVAAAADWWIALPEGLSAEYVGRNRCADCHQPEHQAWTGSDHDLAMDLATPEFVLGNFDNQEFTQFGVTTKFFRQGEDYCVRTENAKGELETFKVKYVFGVRPLQQYMVEFPDGRVQVLSIAWDTKDKRWYSLYPDEKIPAGDWLHWTGAGQNWNYMCAECHSTNLKKNFDLKSNTYHTTFSEIDVSCETCHGPGSIHTELAKGHSLFWDRRYGYGLAKLKSKDSHVEIETCAKCHARRRLVYPGHKGGDDFLDYYAPDLLDGSIYQPDGQLNDEAYEYGSFTQSKMYHKNIRCTDCHNPHTLKLRAEGNQLCARCHSPGKYDSPTHHHHKPATPGATCVECHMPTKNYMIVDPRRDHSLRIPRPDLAVEYGTHSSCEKCHQKEGNEWTAKAFKEWTAGKQLDKEHFARDLVLARRGGQLAEEAELRLARNKQFPDIIRASAMALLSQAPSNAALHMSEKGLTDSSPLVRAIAVRNFEHISPDRLVELRQPPRSEAEAIKFSRDCWQRFVDLVSPLLDDPVRLVRTEAARVLTILPPDVVSLDEDTQESFGKALDEYIAGQKENDDQPASHLNMGVLYANQRRLEEAEQEYLTALRLDPSFVPVRFNLAMLYADRGRSADAEKLYREIVELAPKLAEARYSLGLLLAENKDRLDDAAKELAGAAELDPKHARCRYNLGLAYMQLKKFDEAEKELLAAYELTPPSSPQRLDYVQALVYYYTERNEPEKAARYRQELP